VAESGPFGPPGSQTPEYTHGMPATHGFTEVYSPMHIWGLYKALKKPLVAHQPNVDAVQVAHVVRAAPVIHTHTYTHDRSHD
jgi:hypothetical protein